MSWRVPRPAEGWLTLGLVLLMALLLAWAIDDPRWVVGDDTYTDPLALAAALGVAAGFAGAKVGWPRWLTHVIGATFAALLLPILVGWVTAPGSSPAAAFQVTSDGLVNAYLDLAWRGRQLTNETAHFILVLAAIAWGSGQFAAYAVFGHRRPLNAVVVLGVVLLANMTLTRNDQTRFLVPFSAAALFLLIGMHVFDERLTWARRRIGDPGQLSSLYLRGGTLLVAVTVVGSVVLMNTARSQPLQGMFVGMDQRLIDFGEQLQRILPIGVGGGRPFSPSFGLDSHISSSWETSESLAFTAIVDPPDKKRFYWRSTTYDELRGMDWVQSNTPVAVERVAGGVDLLADTTETFPAGTTREVRYRIEPAEFSDRAILSPQVPGRIDGEAEVRYIGTGRHMVKVDRDRSGTYEALAYVPLEGEEYLTASRLQATAGLAYPEELRQLYTQIPGGRLGPRGAALLAEIKPTVQGATPYDLASRIVEYLRDDTKFEYDIDVADLACRDVVECFAEYRRGFCQYYASTMVMLLRAEGIPARYVQGYLPGDRSDVTGREDVFQSARHAWVEVYFPTWGWYMFDPTGGGVAQTDDLAPGPPLPSPGTSASPGSSLAPRPTPSRRDLEPDDSPSSGGGNTPIGPGPFIALTILLGAAMGGVAFAAWVRGPRGEVSPESAWRGVARLASRFGFAPRPTQTIYEYAGTLGELVPRARPDLETVARAQVEVAYGRAHISTDRLRILRDANRRVRIALLRLIFRRAKRPRGVRKIR